MKEKFDNLKKDGRLDQYMAKKRKHNAQRDRKSMPAKEFWNQIYYHVSWLRVGK